MAHAEEHEGASVKEILIESCRRNNVDLLQETLEGKTEAEIADLLNHTTTVMGNHLYHEAAARGNYEIIDFLLDQDHFECDPTNRLEGDTPLHTAVRWINSEPDSQRDFGNALVDMMLEAGSNSRIKNKGGLTAYQLVDPRNPGLRELIQRHEYTALNKGDFVDNIAGVAGVAAVATVSSPTGVAGVAAIAGHRSRGPVVPAVVQAESDEDEEFSGSDEEERDEWERRRNLKLAARKS